MKSTFVPGWLIASCLLVTFAGCQLGKSPLSSLAWWQKEDTLASKYVEPPSHQFTPSDSAVVSDDPDLPPLPPDIDKTVDSFEEDIARSYRDLARQSENEAKSIASRTREVQVDTRNISAPPTRPPSSADFSNPLTPRASERYSANPDSSFGQGSQSRNSISKTASPSNKNDFMPSSGSESPGMTQYERMAQQSLQPKQGSTTRSPLTPSRTAQPSGQSPLQPSNGSDFRPPSTSPPSSSSSSGSFQPASSGSFQPMTPRQPVQPISTPRALTPPAERSQSTNEYPTTPYQSFQPRVDDVKQQSNQFVPGATSPGSGNSSPSFGSSSKGTPGVTDATKAPSGSFASGTTNGNFNAAKPAGQTANGLSLNLQGQGSYAPGSVRRPDAINPEKLELPMQNFGNSGTPK